MFRIMLVTPAPGSLATLSAALMAQPEVSINWETSGEKALAAAADSQLNLVVVDSHLKDMTPQDFLSRLLQINAMINTAVVSGEPEEDFHEAYEGLGVLVQLAPQPARSEAELLMKKVSELMPPVA